MKLGIRIVVVALALAGLMNGRDVYGAPPPNILVLLADDVSWHDLGVMGNDAVQTPNLDALAEGGLLCTNMFLTIPQCSPSRISVLTGRYPHATGAEDLHMPLPEGTRILPSYLQDAGYFTGHMRKTHYGPNGDKQFQWYSRDVAKFPEFLDEAGDRPFFMWVGYIDAHRGYEEGAFDPPHDPDTVKVPPYLVDDEATRKDLALYYDEIARLDRNSGAMIDELKRREKFENTLIVYFTDNGMPFPRAKGTLYDSGIGTPMIVSWPAKIGAGTKHGGLSSVVDLMPTLLEAAGLKPDDAVSDLHGESMLSRWLNPALPGREYVFSERNWHDNDEHMRSVRTDRYKLIRNAYLDMPHGTAMDLARSPSFQSLLAGKKAGTLTPAQAMLFDAPRPRIELYDVEADPWETKNLAETETGRPIAAELEVVLEAWCARTGDFDPKYRRRADQLDRQTWEKIRDKQPPMTHLPPGEASLGQKSK